MKTAFSIVYYMEGGDHRMDAVKDPGSEREAFIERVVIEHQAALLRLCYMQLQDKSLAEDAVQETFLKAYRAYAQYRGESSEKTWLCRIALNTCRDMQRGAWFRHMDRRVSLDSLPEPVIQPADDKVELTLALMSLPRKLREALMLYYYQDMNTTEIAQTLGIAQSSVSSRLEKGRQLLRRALERREDHA